MIYLLPKERQRGSGKREWNGGGGQGPTSGHAEGRKGGCTARRGGGRGPWAAAGVRTRWN
jgi:hypothetical protein